MRKFIFVVFLTSLSPILSRCSISDQDKIKWASNYDNGLHQRIKSGNYTYDLQYQPNWLLDLLAESNSNISPDTTFQNYILEIFVDSHSKPIEEYSVSSLDEFEERKYYFTYAFENDIFLIDSKERLPCTVFHYESSGGISNKSRFILGFENKKLSKEATLVIQSDYLGSVPVHIKVSKNAP